MIKDISPPPAADSPLAAFNGTIVPNQSGTLYRVGLALVAFAMALLPTLYLALIGFAAWAVYYHVMHDTWWVSRSARQLGLIAYLAPAVAGVILILFMIKPFFAAREKAPERIMLDPEKEPLLFAFVKQICDRVGAPMPSRIDVDCEVNASAGLRRGILSRDLVLTIGLPLAAGLDMRQFAGVLAHEFGHFAQGAGMRLTYIIRHINAWFARVVFERDVWDARLERYAGGAPWQVALLLHVARACVWGTRRILWALMHAGHAMSCFMLRQMEYDADSYEAKLVGSEAFETTVTQLRVLGVATHFAYEHVEHCWQRQRLPENLVGLIKSKSTSLPGEIHQKFITINPEEKTGWFDTHPCDADRVRAARRLNESGIFHSTEPTARLFSDFADLSQRVTRHQYEKRFKLPFTDQDLVSAEELVRESAELAETGSLMGRYYGPVRISFHPLFIERQLPAPGERDAALAEWRAACAEIDALREEAEKVSLACIEQLQRRDQLVTAYYLAVANFEFPPADFGLPDHATTPSELKMAADVALPGAETAIDNHLARLEPFFAALRRRVGLALRLHAKSDAGSLVAAEETTMLVPLVAAVGAEMKEVQIIAARVSALTALAENRGNHPDVLHVDEEILKLASDLQRRVTLVKERVGGLTYPFDHPGGHLTIAEFLQVAHVTPIDWQRTHEDGMALVNRLIELHRRLIGRILVAADSAEKALEL